MSMKKVLFSGMVGNALEWYDYALYAQFSGIISMTFFPDTLSADVRGILTFAIFAAGFIIRPIGAVVFGIIGDRYGRRLALTIGILTMALPTAFIGLLPSYEAIGLMAPILLTLIRMIQGFSLGGEFSGCIAYIVESSPKKVRGLAGSAAFVSMCLGMLLGSVVAELFRSFMSEAALNAWGWRVPFVCGMLVGGIGIYIRMRLHESAVYQHAKNTGNLSRSPVRDLLKDYKKPLFISIALYLSVTVPFYTITVFSDTLIKRLGFSGDFAGLSNILIMITMTIALPLSAYASDLLGRRRVMMTSITLFALLTYPLFWIVANVHTEFACAGALATFAALCGLYMGPIPTVLVENFPTKVRFTGVALSYNISAALFGGTAPVVLLSMLEKYNDVTLIAIYIMLFIFITLYSMRYYVDHSGLALSEYDDEITTIKAA